MAKQTRNEGAALVWMFAPLVIWAGHFLVVYPAAAVLCVRDIAAGAEAAAAINFVATVAALLGISLVAGRALYSVIDTGGDDENLEQPSGQALPSRHFLHRMTLLIAALSFVAVLYSLMPALLSAHCS